jgi:hypothetical protein
MSERGGTQPTQNVSWARGASPHQVIEPTAKRDKGWFEGTGNDDADFHPAGYENWLDQAHGDYLGHMATIIVREFSDLDEAIAATSSPDRFVVHAPTPMVVPWVEKITKTPTVSTPVDGLSTDGQYIYYSHLDDLYAIDPEAGTALSGWTPPDNAYHVAADGLYVYHVEATAAAKATITNRLTGALVGNLVYHASNTKVWNAIRANGYYAAAIYDDDTEDKHLSIWDEVGATPNKIGDFSHGTTGNDLYGLAIDHERAFVGGIRGSGNADVRAVALKNAVQLWAVTIGDTAMTVRSIATDGELVYVGCNATAVGGASTNLFALDRYTGTLIWKMLVPTFTDTLHVVVDDRYLYVSGGDSAGQEEVAILLKLNQAVLHEIPGLWATDADGVSFVGRDATDTLYRHLRGGVSREFMRANGDDPNRRPWFKLALPIHGG